MRQEFSLIWFRIPLGSDLCESSLLNRTTNWTENMFLIQINFFLILVCIHLFCSSVFVCEMCSFTAKTLFTRVCVEEECVECMCVCESWPQEISYSSNKNSEHKKLFYLLTHNSEAKYSSSTVKQFIHHLRDRKHRGKRINQISVIEFFRHRMRKFMIH